MVPFAGQRHVLRHVNAEFVEREPVRNGRELMRRLLRPNAGFFKLRSGQIVSHVIAHLCHRLWK